MPWVFFSLDEFSFEYGGIVVVLVCRSLNLIASTSLDSVGGQLVVEVEFGLFEK